MEQFGKLLLSLPDGHEQEYMLGKPTIILGRSATSESF
jgi:hypothetical protein